MSSSLSLSRDSLSLNFAASLAGSTSPPSESSAAAAMADLPDKRRSFSSSSSASSSDLSVRLDREVVPGDGVESESSKGIENDGSSSSRDAANGVSVDNGTTASSGL